MTKNVEDIEVPTLEEMKEMISSIPDEHLRDKAILSTLYITGARVCEIVKRLRLKDISVKEHKGRKYISFYLFTAKRQRRVKQIYRNIPVSYDKYKVFVDPLIDYIRQIKPRDDDYVFDITTRTVLNITHKWLDFHTHFIRHVRISHLVQHHNFNDQELTKWTGWSNSNPAATYSHLDERVFFEKL